VSGRPEKEPQTRIAEAQHPAKITIEQIVVHERETEAAKGLGSWRKVRDAVVPVVRGDLIL
jgi:hypothetical protein